ncbi:hypothetical protein ACIHCV_38120 [Streptomyces sp. NPDC051956]|uniref:hypothetical protein n=1 Tax=Streptomyces sp. NPDC051956 TaxID=3365677 RepID=UPI0037CF64F8
MVSPQDSGLVLDEFGQGGGNACHVPALAKFVGGLMPRVQLIAGSREVFGCGIPQGMKAMHFLLCRRTSRYTAG